MPLPSLFASDCLPATVPRVSGLPPSLPIPSESFGLSSGKPAFIETISMGGNLAIEMSRTVHPRNRIRRYRRQCGLAVGASEYAVAFLFCLSRWSRFLSSLVLVRCVPHALPRQSYRSLSLWPRCGNEPDGSFKGERRGRLVGSPLSPRCVSRPSGGSRSARRSRRLSLSRRRVSRLPV